MPAPYLGVSLQAEATTGQSGQIHLLNQMRSSHWGVEISSPV